MSKKYKDTSKIIGDRKYNAKFINEKPVNFKSISAETKSTNARKKIIYFLK